MDYSGFEDTAVLLDGTLAFCVLLMNGALIITISCARRRAKSSEELAIALFSMSHLPIGLFIIPLRIFVRCRGNRTFSELCGLIISTYWTFYILTIISFTLFSLYEMAYNDPSSARSILMKPYRRISFILLTFMGIATLCFCVYLCHTFSRNRFDVCALHQSLPIVIFFTLTLCLCPLLLVWIRYFNTDPTDRMGFLRSMKIFSFKKEGASCTSSTRGPLYRKLFFPRLTSSQTSSQTSQIEQLPCDTKLSTSGSEMELDTIKQDAVINQSNNRNSKKNVQIDVATLNTQLPSGATFSIFLPIVDQLTYVYLIFWMPHVICSFLGVVGYIEKYHFVFWTTRLICVNSLIVPIVLRIYLRTVQRNIII